MKGAWVVRWSSDEVNFYCQVESARQQVTLVGNVFVLVIV